MRQFFENQPVRHAGLKNKDADAVIAKIQREVMGPALREPCGAPSLKLWRKRPEFLNRVDELIMFRGPSPKSGRAAAIR